MNACVEGRAFEAATRAAPATPLPAGTLLRDCVVTGVIDCWEDNGTAYM